MVRLTEIVIHPESIGENPSQIDPFGYGNLHGCDSSVLIDEDPAQR